MSLLIGFSGQGSHHSEMFKRLSEDRYGKNWLLQASELVGVDLFDKTAVEKASTDVILVQCLIVILSVGAFYSLQKQAQLTPDFLCGYSLGEISAFAVSIDLDLAELHSLVQKRALLMQEAANQFANNQETGMAVLKGRVDYSLVKELTEKHGCYIAIVNAADHYIVGGLHKALVALELEAKTRGVRRAELLAVNLASHTPILAKASDGFSLYLQKFQTSAMRYPVLNALTQELVSDTSTMLTILARELSETLYWGRLMHVAAEYGVSTFLELGPRATLKNMILANVPTLRAYNLEGFSSMAGLAGFLKGKSI